MLRIDAETCVCELAPFPGFKNREAKVLARILALITRTLQRNRGRLAQSLTCKLISCPDFRAAIAILWGGTRRET